MALPNMNGVLVIAVMGPTGTGKSSFVNLASGSNFAVGSNLEACTPDVQISQPFDFQEKRLALIDTPGFDDTTMSDREVLQRIATFLEDSYNNEFRLAGVIYMHRITDNKMGGVSRRNFGLFRSLCGDNNLSSVVIVTNMWGLVNASVGAAREQELRSGDTFFKPILDKGAKMTRHNNTIASAHIILNLFINNDPVILKIQQETAIEKKPLDYTSAGVELITREIQLELDKENERHDVTLRCEREGHQARLNERNQRLREEREQVEIEMGIRRRREERRKQVEIERRQRQRQENELKRRTLQRKALEEETLRLAKERRVRELEEERARIQFEHDAEQGRLQAEYRRRARQQSSTSSVSVPCLAATGGVVGVTAIVLGVSIACCCTIM